MRHNSMKIAMLIAAGWLFLAGPGAHAQGSGAPAAQRPAGNAKNGEKLYKVDGCYQCHNLQGQGGGAGPRLAPNPIPLPAFIAYVRKPTAQMPPYTSKVLPDADLADMYAFLQTIPKSLPAKSIPMLIEP